MNKQFDREAFTFHLSLDEAATQHKARMAKLTWDYEAEEAEQKLRRLQANQRCWSY